jgi:hypothetical protein
MTVQRAVWQTSTVVSDKRAVCIFSAEESLEGVGGSKITLTAARTSILTQHY